MDVLHHILDVAGFYRSDKKSLDNEIDLDVLIVIITEWVTNLGIFIKYKDE